MLVLPYEGRALIARYLLRRDLADRDGNLMLGLFTNLTADLTLGLATVTEPTGNGYERLPLDDLQWVADAFGNAAFPQTIFTAGAGGWNGLIQGAFIATRGDGGTPRMLAYEFDNQQTLAAAALARIGAVVTVVTPVPHQLVTGQRANVRGADQIEYNGVFAVTVTGAQSFTYTVGGSPVSPATGTIKVNRCFQMDVGSRYGPTLNLSFASG